MNSLLEQTGPVNDLLLMSIKALSHIENIEIREELEAAIKVFSRVICPSNISLDEVTDLAEKYQINIPNQQALNILQNAANDIDFNYAGQAVEYHFEHYSFEIIHKQANV
jgi:hypothetical protein